MKIQLLAIGKAMPAWVEAGCQEYLKRMPRDYRVEIVECPALKRSNNADTEKIARLETTALLQKVTKNSAVIALERRGTALSSLELAQRLKIWHDQAQDLSLLIGGPEGLDLATISPYEQWGISALTLPHPLVRVIMAEQLYRAVCILQQHPYHR